MEIVKKNGNGSSRLPDLPEWDDKLLLGFEKEALGFYITGHPLDRYSADIKRLSTADTSTLAAQKDKSEVRICGIVAALKEFNTKRGDRMAFVTLEDLHGVVEVVVFADVYLKAAGFLKGEEPLLVTGTVDVGEESCKVMAKEIVPLREASEKQATRVHFQLKTPGLQKQQLALLKEI